MFYVPDDIYFAPYANMEKMAKFYNGFYPDFSFDTFRKLSEVFGLDTKARINGFSKGMQRQAEIVLGISTKPDFILFDEPLTDLTPLSEHLLRICLMNIWQIQMHPLLFLHMTFMNLKGFVTISALSTAKACA